LNLSLCKAALNQSELYKKVTTWNKVSIDNKSKLWD